jgi:hypothetical protein
MPFLPPSPSNAPDKVGLRSIPVIIRIGLVAIAVAFAVCLPAYGQPKNLRSAPCPSCGAEFPHHLAGCPSRPSSPRTPFAQFDQQAMADGLAGLFMGLYELFSGIGNALSSASSVRDAPAPRSLPESRQLAKMAADLGNSHRELAMGINSAFEAAGRAGLSPVSTAPVVGLLIESIVAAHAAIHATVGAQVLAQFAGSSSHMGANAPSLAGLREHSAPPGLRASVQPMLNNPGAFARCPSTKQYISMCECGRHR